MRYIRSAYEYYHFFFHSLKTTKEADCVFLDFPSLNLFDSFVWLFILPVHSLKDFLIFQQNASIHQQKMGEKVAQVSQFFVLFFFSIHHNWLLDWKLFWFFRFDSIIHLYSRATTFFNPYFYSVFCGLDISIIRMIAIFFRHSLFLVFSIHIYFDSLYIAVGLVYLLISTWQLSIHFSIDDNLSRHRTTQLYTCIWSKTTRYLLLNYG